MNQPINSCQDSSNSALASNKHQEDFLLDGSASVHEDFSLESDMVETQLDQEPVQNSLLLHTEDPEQPEPSAQIDLDGMDKAIHKVSIINGSLPAKDVSFQHANTLLEGEVHYTEEPMAWINDDEILPCCCIPKTAISIKLP